MSKIKQNKQVATKKKMYLNLCFTFLSLILMWNKGAERRATQSIITLLYQQQTFIFMYLYSLFMLLPLRHTLPILTWRQNRTKKKKNVFFVDFMLLKVGDQTMDGAENVSTAF